MLLERGDFKLSVGSLNNKFPFMVEGLINFLQSTQSQDFNMAKSRFQHGKVKISTWQSQDFNMAKSRFQHGKVKISTWQSMVIKSAQQRLRNQNWRKRQVKLNSNNILIQNEFLV